MKKIISIMCCISILVISTFSCFAALNSTKSQILSELKSGATTGVTTLYIPVQYISQAENYLNSNDISQEQADKILANIKSAKDIIATTNATSFQDLRKNDAKFQQIISLAGDASATVNLKLTYGGGKNFTITDSSGKIIFTTDSVTKTTGSNINIKNAAIIGSTIGVFLVISGFVIYKNRLCKNEKI